MLISHNPKTIQFNTGEDAPDIPQNPMTIDEEQECRVTWQPPLSPNGMIMMYTLYVQITTHNDEDEILERLVFRTSNTGYNISKAGYPPDRLFRFFVSAMTSAGEGSNATSPSFSCSQPVGVPDKPLMPSTPRAEDITINSFTTMLPEYTNNNGPISCFEIIVMQVSDPQADINDITIPDIVLGYEETDNRLNTPYQAFVFSDLPSMITVGGSSRQTTSCNTGSALLNALNGPLTPGGRYTCFIRVYSPTGDVNRTVLFENGQFMSITQLSDEVMPSTSAASPGRPIESSMNIMPIAVGAGAGGVVIICAIIIVVVCYKRRSEERSPLDVDRTNLNDEDHEDGEQYVNSAFIPNSYEEMSENAKTSSAEAAPGGHPYDPVRVSPIQSRKDPPRPTSETNVKPPDVTLKTNTNPQPSSPFQLSQVILKPTPQQSSGFQKQLAPKPTCRTTSKAQAVSPNPNVSTKPKATPRPVATRAPKAAAKPGKPSVADKPRSDDRVKVDGKPVSSLKPVRKIDDGKIYENEEVGQQAPPSRGQSWGAGINPDDRVYDPVRISPVLTRKEPTKPPVVTSKPRVTSRP